MDISILIVDDDKLVVEKLVEGVNWKQLGIRTVLTACNIRQAKEILEEVTVDILLSDIEMPQGSGLELLEWVRDKEIPVVKACFQQGAGGGPGEYCGGFKAERGVRGRRRGAEKFLLGEIFASGKRNPIPNPFGEGLQGGNLQPRRKIRSAAYQDPSRFGYQKEKRSCLI